MRFNIKTEYYARGDSKNAVRTTRAADGINATTNAVRYLQQGFGDIAVVEVHDTLTAELHAVITMSPTGDIRIVFKRDPKTPRCIVVE